MRELGKRAGLGVSHVWGRRWRLHGGSGSTRRFVPALGGQNPGRSWTVAATGRGLSHDERELVPTGP